MERQPRNVLNKINYLNWNTDITEFGPQAGHKETPAWAIFAYILGRGDGLVHIQGFGGGGERNVAGAF